MKEKADRAELCIRIGECEQELQELLANPAALPDLTGCKINHKVFGAGTVRPAEGQFMVIDFNGTLKKFSYTASMNSGYLSAEDPNVEARLQAYQDYNKDKERLEKELKEPEGGIGEAVIGNRPSGRMLFAPAAFCNKKNPCV